MTTFAAKTKNAEPDSVKSNGTLRKSNDLQAGSMIESAPRFGFPIQRKVTCACGGGCPKCQTKSANLPISQPHDASEIEADSMADKVMRMSDNEFSPIKNVQSSANNLQRKCGEGEEGDEIQRKGETNSNASSIREQSANVGEALETDGQSLSAETRAFFEPRFGTDFSGVRIHSDEKAATSAQNINALAYTFGNDIVFNQNQYQPETEGGKHLLAHELAHVQQGNGTIRRCANPKVNDPNYDALAKKIESHAVYTALDPAVKTVADGIIVEAKKKSDCLYLLGKLKLLFDTPKAVASTVAAATRTAVAAEHKKEQTRIAKPTEAKKLNIEEDASKAAAGKLKPVKGKFGKDPSGAGTYQLDKSDLANIVIKAKIFLYKHGAGTDDDVQKIKDMQDGIEKAASIKGFLVDIEFVDVADAETFDVKVNPSAWTVADEWGSGGTPLAYAHEIFHLFAFELDRYNYIESHSANQDMEIPDRLHWFAQQLAKPAGFDDPTSIMASGSHPTDEDVCTVADVPSVADCVKDRKKAAKP